MEKILAQVNIIETDDGYRVQAAGKKVKELMNCGCLPLVAGCCSPLSAGKIRAAGECCPPDQKKDD